MVYFNTLVTFLAGWLFFALQADFLAGYPRFVNEFLYPFLGLVLLFLFPLVMQSRKDHPRIWLLLPLLGFGAGYGPVWLGQYLGF